MVVGYGEVTVMIVIIKVVVAVFVCVIGLCIGSVVEVLFALFFDFIG